MANKKILYLITQSEFGGAQRYIFDLANNLKNDWQIDVASGIDGDSTIFIEKLKSINVDHYPINSLKRDIHLASDWKATQEIKDLIKKINPDVIHLNSTKISIVGVAACLLAGYKGRIVYTAHGWVFNEPMSASKRWLYKNLEKYFAIPKNKIICLNKKEYNQAKNTLNINSEKLSIIYHGPMSISLMDKMLARQKLNLSSRKFAVGLIGNFYATKGLSYFIDAAKIISQEFKLDIKFVIIGEGHLRTELEKQISDNRLQDIIHLTGAIDQAATILPAFDIYVCSSVKEGFPYSILEAMSARLPIIATRVGGIPEMITDGADGLLVESKNSHQLAQAIKKLYEDQELRNELATAAKKTVEEKFTIKKMVKETEKTYNT